MRNFPQPIPSTNRRCDNSIRGANLLRLQIVCRVLHLWQHLSAGDSLAICLGHTSRTHSIFVCTGHTPCESKQKALFSFALSLEEIGEEE